MANHFHALCEALPDLRAVALFDRLGRELPEDGAVEWLIWERREFENYVATRRTLERYAAASGRDATPGPLFAESEQSNRVAAMSRSIATIEEARQGFPLRSRRQGQRRFPHTAVRGLLREAGPPERHA